MFRAARPKDIAGPTWLASRPTQDHAYPYTRLGQDSGVERSVARVIGAASLPRRGATHAFVITHGKSPGALVVVRGTKAAHRGRSNTCLSPGRGRPVRRASAATR